MSILTSICILANVFTAQSAYDAGNYEDAMNAYYQTLATESSEDPRVQYNLANTLYKQGLFDESSAAYEQSLKQETPALQAQSYFNWGNSLYREGQSTERLDPDTTIQKWESAINRYESALALTPEDPDIQANIDFVRQKLEQLQQQQQQDNQDQQNPDNSDQAKPEQQNSDQQDQAQSNESQSDQPQEQKQPEPPKKDSSSDAQHNQAQPPSPQDPSEQPQQQHSQMPESGKLDEASAARLLDAFGSQESAWPLSEEGASSSRGTLKDW